MILRTELKINPSGDHLRVSDPVFLIGSCFSGNIGNKLALSKFKVLVNPFGTIYNPFSIFELIGKSVRGEWKTEEEDIVFNQDTYRHLGFHSSVSSTSKSGLTELATKSFSQTGEFLHQAQWVIITFGTAVIYSWNRTGRVAANCHKLPAGEFNKRFLSIDEIQDQFDKIHRLLTGINNELKIILTVSPVRHLKEGFENNQFSKSVLGVACRNLVSRFSNVHYFPAYEIMIDDLRDYRFYEEDLVHPNAQATGYIWEKFCQTYMDEPTRDFIRDWDRVLKAIHHRPFHPETGEYKKFIRQTLEQLQSFKDKVDISEELKILTGQL